MESTRFARPNVPVRPFPWRRLEATTRTRLLQSRALGRFLESTVDVGRARLLLEALTRTSLSLHLRSIEPARLGQGGPEVATFVAVTFVVAGTGAPELALQVEAEPALVARLVSGALGKAAPFAGQRPLLPTPGRPVEPELAHAWAALLASAARARDPSVEPLPERLREPLVVAGVGSVRALEGARPGTWLAVSYLVGVDGESFQLRILVPSEKTEQAAPLAFERTTLRTLGDLPLRLPLVADAGVLSASDLASLRPGDAWVPATWPLVRSPDGTWTGPLSLASPSREEGTAVDLTSDGRLVLRGTVRALSWTAPDDMERREGDPVTKHPTQAPAHSAQPPTPHQGSEALLRSLGDAPVVLRVEVGSVELPARAWAELAPGDVVGLGRRVAEPVILRVAGREIARGELVDLDGEVGVRILSRMEIDA